MSIEIWRYGYDGLLVSIFQRAYFDYRYAMNIDPAEVERIAKKHSGSLGPELCRHALNSGFDTPLEELEAFFENCRVHQFLSLCTVDPETMVERIKCE